MVTEGSW